MIAHGSRFFIITSPILEGGKEGYGARWFIQQADIQKKLGVYDDFPDL